MRMYGPQCREAVKVVLDAALQTHITCIELHIYDCALFAFVGRCSVQSTFQEER